MSDEIKEIIESSRKIIKSNRENGFDRIIMLGDDIDKLLDYITNLEKKYDKALTDLVHESHKRIELENKITNLQKENDILKENAIHNDKVVDKAKWNEMIYKSRIDKAREMIRFIAYNSERPLTITELNKVYNTLGGDDNE